MLLLLATDGVANVTSLHQARTLFLVVYKLDQRHRSIIICFSYSSVYFSRLDTSKLLTFAGKYTWHYLAEVCWHLAKNIRKLGQVQGQSLPTPPWLYPCGPTQFVCLFRSMGSSFWDTMESRKSKMATILENISTLIRQQNDNIPTLNLTLWAQFFCHFRSTGSHCRDTVEKSEKTFRSIVNISCPN